jgi:hypothetical protein
VADKLVRQGLTLNRVDQDPFRQRLRPYHQAWAGAFGLTIWGLLQGSIGEKLE